MKGEQPYLGDLLTMVIIHLLTGMILKVVVGPSSFKSGETVDGRNPADHLYRIFFPQQYWITLRTGVITPATHLFLAIYRGYSFIYY